MSKTRDKKKSTNKVGVLVHSNSDKDLAKRMVFVSEETFNSGFNMIRN